MIRLPNTGTYSLELITAQNGAQVVVCYSDATSTAYTGGIQPTSITSATTTTICATPATSTVRDVDEINIKNTYAGSHTITVQVDANATNYPLITAALLENESLNYTHGSGWQCKDANGNTKASALTAMTSAQLRGIVTDETGDALLYFQNGALGAPASGDTSNCTTNTEAANNNSTQHASTAYADRLTAGTLPGAFTTVVTTDSILIGVAGVSTGTTGEIGIANSKAIRWRNAANTAYLNAIYVDELNNLQFGGGGATANTEISVGGTGLVSTFSTTGQAVIGAISATTSILSSGATNGVGYSTGAGGTITQITSRTTGVTINKINGAITLVSAAGSAAWQSFTVTNSAMAATDRVVVDQKSGTDLNQIHVTNRAAGSFQITFATTGGTTTEQPVFGFSIIKGVEA